MTKGHLFFDSLLPVIVVIKTYMVLVYASNAVITDGNFVRVSTQILKDKQSMDNATEGLVQHRHHATLSNFVIFI